MLGTIGGRSLGKIPLASLSQDERLAVLAAERISVGRAIAFDGEFYAVDGFKISKKYYEGLWSRGRPAPFLQAREIMNSNPKVMPDPMGAPGYMRYEGAGMEMIYNPKTGQIGHVQPLRK